MKSPIKLSNSIISTPFGSNPTRRSSDSIHEQHVRSNKNISSSQSASKTPKDLVLQYQYHKAKATVDEAQAEVSQLRSYYWKLKVEKENTFMTETQHLYNEQSQQAKHKFNFQKEIIHLKDELYSNEIYILDLKEKIQPSAIERLKNEVNALYISVNDLYKQSQQNQQQISSISENIQTSFNLESHDKAQDYNTKIDRLHIQIREAVETHRKLKRQYHEFTANSTKTNEEELCQVLSKKLEKAIFEKTVKERLLEEIQNIQEDEIKKESKKQLSSRKYQNQLPGVNDTIKYQKNSENQLHENDQNSSLSETNGISNQHIHKTILSKKNINYKFSPRPTKYQIEETNSSNSIVSQHPLETQISDISLIAETTSFSQNPNLLSRECALVHDNKSGRRNSNHSDINSTEIGKNNETILSNIQIKKGDISKDQLFSETEEFNDSQIVSIKDLHQETNDSHIVHKMKMVEESMIDSEYFISEVDQKSPSYNELNKMSEGIYSKDLEDDTEKETDSLKVGPFMTKLKKRQILPDFVQYGTVIKSIIEEIDQKYYIYIKFKRQNGAVKARNSLNGKMICDTRVNICFTKFPSEIDNLSPVVVPPLDTLITRIKEDKKMAQSQIYDSPPSPPTESCKENDLSENSSFESVETSILNLSSTITQEPDEIKEKTSSTKGNFPQTQIFTSLTTNSTLVSPLSVFEKKNNEKDTVSITANVFSSFSIPNEDNLKNRSDTESKNLSVPPKDINYISESECEKHNNSISNFDENGSELGKSNYILDAHNSDDINIMENENKLSDQSPCADLIPNKETPTDDSQKFSYNKNQQEINMNKYSNNKKQPEIVGEKNDDENETKFLHNPIIQLGLFSKTKESSQKQDKNKDNNSKCNFLDFQKSKNQVEENTNNLNINQESFQNEKQDKKEETNSHSKNSDEPKPVIDIFHNLNIFNSASQQQPEKQNIEANQHKDEENIQISLDISDSQVRKRDIDLINESKSNDSLIDLNKNELKLNSTSEKINENDENQNISTPNENQMDLTGNEEICEKSDQNVISQFEKNDELSNIQKEELKNENLFSNDINEEKNEQINSNNNSEYHEEEEFNNFEEKTFQKDTNNQGACENSDENISLNGEIDIISKDKNFHEKDMNDVIENVFNEDISCENSILENNFQFTIVMTPLENITKFWRTVPIPDFGGPTESTQEYDFYIQKEFNDPENALNFMSDSSNEDY